MRGGRCLAAEAAGCFWAAFSRTPQGPGGIVGFHLSSGGSIHHGRYPREVGSWSHKHVWLLKSVVHLKFKGGAGGYSKSTKLCFKQKDSLALEARAQVDRRPELHRFQTRLRRRQWPIAVRGGLAVSLRAVVLVDEAGTAPMHARKLEIRPPAYLHSCSRFEWITCEIRFQTSKSLRSFAQEPVRQKLALKKCTRLPRLQSFAQLADPGAFSWPAECEEVSKAVQKSPALLTMDAGPQRGSTGWKPTT